MRTITLKSIPDDLHEQLKKSAALHQRSLNSEILFRLRESLGNKILDGDKLLAKARALRSQVRGQLNDKTVQELKQSGRK